MCLVLKARVIGNIADATVKHRRVSQIHQAGGVVFCG